MSSFSGVQGTVLLAGSYACPARLVATGAGFSSRQWFDPADDPFPGAGSR
jgi:hypothetical protein